MRGKSFESLQSLIARSLERVGEWWRILTSGDAFLGATRFDRFQKSLDNAPNILTRRLAAPVEGGMLEKRRYSERLLTARGRDFRSVLRALLASGNRHLRPLKAPGFPTVPGPAADDDTCKHCAARVGAATTTRRIQRPAGGVHV
jgi:DNA-binding HxlR family transcriptional regulator